jgi:protein gp37
MFDHLSTGRWWDIGIDLVTGCTPVSPACEHCWSAERTHRVGQQRNLNIRARYGGLTNAQKHFTGEVRPQWDFLPRIGSARKPQVYTFWNDLFHPGAPEEFVDAVMVRITQRLEHFYIICTKRPERALKYYSDPSRSWVRNAFQKSLMLMTTVERQEEADLRLPILLRIPGVMHGVSYEPALGPIDIWQYLGGNRNPIGPALCGKGLDWLIAGAETGPHARPSHPDWFRQARDQAVAAAVPFFLKSWWKWAPYEIDNNIGKKADGRLLDGRTWDETPHA